MPTTEEEQTIESLQRALDEIDVLEAIYGGGCHDQDDEDTASAFSVITVAELQKARDLTVSSGSDSGAASYTDIPQLEIELRIPVIMNEDNTNEESASASDATIRCRLPQGYPLIPAVIAIISLAALRRGSREELSNEVNQHAQELAGQEAILQLVDYTKEKAAELLERDRLSIACKSKSDEYGDRIRNNTDDVQPSTRWGRRWIWVHHITNAGRCKSIVQEAEDLGLGGYLKPGYPGVVVVEGPSSFCDEFVVFIKGNKSRPGGFGRNWGHHVRGHVDFENDTEVENGKHAEEQQLRPQLPTEFKELEEDLAVLSKLCRECGLEDEFKEYVMQHKG